MLCMYFGRHASRIIHDDNFAWEPNYQSGAMAKSKSQPIIEKVTNLEDASGSNLGLLNQS